MTSGGSTTVRIRPQQFHETAGPGDNEACIGVAGPPGPATD
ncbi:MULTISPECIES: hypothetical protein [unclassified Streptomyces]|nr:hypothetical protein [Streptomyces sp. NBC_00441]